MPRVPNQKQHDALAEVVLSLGGVVQTQGDVADALAAQVADIDIRVARLEEAPPDLWVPRFPGDPKTGTAYWGCSQDNNAEPTAHEQATGLPVGVRRVFISDWYDDDTETSIANMLAEARRYIDQDEVAGRLTWISFKTPSWVEMAAGEHDDTLDQLLRLLHLMQRNIWVSFFHEPEDNVGALGQSADWRAMQSRIRSRLPGDSLALVPTLMGSTFRLSTGRDPEEWWVNDTYDFLGVDHYAVNEGVPLVSSFQWQKCLDFAASKGVPLAVGEWGTHTPGLEGAEFIREFWESGLANGVVGFSCYDNAGGSRGPWNLEGDQLAEFRAIMGDERVARV